MHQNLGQFRLVCGKPESKRFGLADNNQDIFVTGPFNVSDFEIVQFDDPERFGCAFQNHQLFLAVQRADDRDIFARSGNCRCFETGQFTISAERRPGD